MATGNIELVPRYLEVLNRCKDVIPFAPDDAIRVNETTRLTHRYLELRGQHLQEALRTRSRFVNDCRRHLLENEFVEVETPTLFRRTPGGAREFVVPTKRGFYCLPQSPQQFKQLLMVGGVDKYFQVARCYRDEGGRSDRQPEFTQLDIEMSFVDSTHIMSLIEDILAKAWPLDGLETPFLQLPYNQAISMYGTDKPDTRFQCTLQDVRHLTLDCGIAGFGGVGNDDAVRALRFPCSDPSLRLSKSAIDRFVDEEIEGRLDGVEIGLWTVDADFSVHGPQSTGQDQEKLQQLGRHLGCEAGDAFVVASGPATVACLLLGKLRNFIGSRMELVCFNCLWVTDFPLFYESVDGRITSAHHPFTAPTALTESLVYTKPLDVTGQHFDLVINGVEIGGGSIRIHDSRLQRYILTRVLDEDCATLEHLLQALDCGCPPHGGIALGIDRLLAVLLNRKSIRDVIAFPKSSEGTDLMCNAPSSLPVDYLQGYGIRSVPG